MVYGTVILTLDNVLLPKEKLTPTPSFQDGMDEETEKDLRITGCDLIQSSGILLRLPQTAMATGQVLFQRFYYSKSFVRQAMETTAMACVYLASKIEEAPRRIRDVINVFHHIRLFRSQKTIQPLILDPSYIRLKSDVTLAERRILKELGFCVHVKHPHKLVVIYMQQLGYGKETKFIQMAWNYMNDALRSNVFVVHTPEAIACACIFLSARILNISLPPAWFLVFDKLESELVQISTQIMDLYERPVINFDELEKKVAALTKAYQESRQKPRADTSGGSGGNSSTHETMKPDESKPSQNTVQPSVPPPDIVVSNPSTPPPPPPKAVEKQSVSSNSNYTHPNPIQSRKHKQLGDEINGNYRRKHDDYYVSPVKKARRTPSPIIYHESPSRHKHKKRKKMMSSRSRSYERMERKMYKKSYHRERSPTPESARKHHKRKSHHR